jgi:uncharacterized protein YodC (DUF2158 family)
MDIKAGDVVQLNSGGPKMTVQKVEAIDGAISAWCQWFDEKNKPQSQQFVLTSLKKSFPK